jgi:hypothetical protein
MMLSSGFYRFGTECISCVHPLIGCKKHICIFIVLKLGGGLCCYIFRVKWGEKGYKGDFIMRGKPSI